MPWFRLLYAFRRLAKGEAVLFVDFKVDVLSVDVWRKRAYLLVVVGFSQSDRVQNKSERRILR